MIGVLAKSKDLVQAFGTDDQSKVCLCVYWRKESCKLQGRRGSPNYLVVMQKTYNPETKRPYTISMIERLMHDINFAVEPNSSSKKQNMPSLLEKNNGWNSTIVSREESGSQLSVICELEPGLFRECDALVRSLQGRLDILAVNVHMDSDTHVDHYDDLEEESSGSQGEVKQQKCNTCNAFVGDAKEYREHFKSEWHKHNMRRKTRQLPPLSAEECMGDMEIVDSKADLKDYSF
ncbi:hypothetical protein SASPL_104146 [Salvia splendens]|uniref:U1-type domain-containing protein n=1 Tax=Salvia splendens TaxID=180675 RepID=A0A8X9A9J0_SALSN|nr:hypothetical protein SASPL_104146 [Salvia splendens]